MSARLLPLGAAASLAVVFIACTPGSDRPVTGTGGVSTSTGGSSSGSGGSAPGSGGSTGTSRGGSTSSGSGSGGASNGSGGSATGGDTSPGSGGAGPGSGGAAGGSTGSGTGGVPSATGGQQGAVTFQKAAGTIANTAMPASMTNLAKADWKKGFVSGTLLDKHHIGQSFVVNGYLVVGGNEEFWIYDVSTPATPKLLSTMNTPNRNATAGPKGEGEAESHTISFARYGNNFYMVTTGGTGIDTWDITSATAPKHLAQLKISGVSYGDYTEAVWGLSWQGQYIYVGTTNNGINIIDAANPAALTLAGHISTSAYGDVSAGPVDAIGNVLVVMTPKESGGVATLDISDPVKPTKLASFTTDKSYIGQFWRHWVFLQSPVRAWDVLTNPSSIGSGSSPIGSLTTPKSEYMSFGDDYMFLGHVRVDAGADPGASKITVSDPKNMKQVNRIWGREDRGDINDDQFTTAIGNLLVMGDDEAPYAGFIIAVHQAEPDTKPPIVDTVIPKDKATGVSTLSRIGVTFSDNIELATVNAASFIVRPMGGQPLAGKWGVRAGVLNFDPDEDLQPATTYEVVLPKGGIADFVGNTLATDWKSTFTTK